MIKLLPDYIDPCMVRDEFVHDPLRDVIPCFVVHPPTSELAERLMLDPESLSNENYSGIYDESGDYIPQYCDDPEKIPQSIVKDVLTPNKDGSEAPSGPPGGDSPGPDTFSPDDSKDS